MVQDILGKVEINLRKNIKVNAVDDWKETAWLFLVKD